MSSKADRYRETVDRLVEGGSRGTIIMVSIFVLSAILSALFFWRHSQGVFAGIPWIFATVLGLLIGLIPSEGAFFGWKDIQKKRAEELTGPQLAAATWGMWFGIAFAVMNISGLFLTSFPGVPEAMMQITPWVAFLALFLPIPLQLFLFARYSTNEKSVIEARQKAKLGAAKHASAIRAEKARIGAVLEGMDSELEVSLDHYGQETGRENAQTALTAGQRDIMGGFYERLQGTQSAPQSGPRITPDEIAAYLAANPEAIRLALPVSNSTHDTVRHTPDVSAAPGQGEGNGAPGKALSRSGPNF